MASPPETYFDTSSWDARDVVSGGSRMVPIDTPRGRFRVWTKRVGTNPDLKVLLLHGGPGATDELLRVFRHLVPGRRSETLYRRVVLSRDILAVRPSAWLGIPNKAGLTLL